MCQTEVIRCSHAERPLLSSARVLNDPRVHQKLLVTSEFDFGSTDLELIEDKRTPPPACQPCPVSPHDDFTIGSYLEEHLTPWLLNSLITLSTYSSQFVGPKRSALMIEWLRNGALGSKSSRLQQAFTRALQNGGSFETMLQIIKTAVMWNESRIEETNLRTLLKWRGAEVGRSMKSAWSQWLDTYQQISEARCEAYDQELKAQIRSFLVQSPLLTTAVMNSLPEIVFLKPEGGIISRPPTNTDDYHHRRLACAISDAFQVHTQAFGRADEFIAFYEFGRFRKEKVEKREDVRMLSDTPVLRPAALGPKSKSFWNKKRRFDDSSVTERARRIHDTLVEDSN